MNSCIRQRRKALVLLSLTPTYIPDQHSFSLLEIYLIWARICQYILTIQVRGKSSIYNGPGFVYTFLQYKFVENPVYAMGQDLSIHFNNTSSWKILYMQWARICLLYCIEKTSFFQSQISQTSFRRACVLLKSVN